MSDIERGEPDLYEVTWQNGHVDRILAHQITRPTWLFGGALFGGPDQAQRPQRVEFHGEFEGHWRLVLSANEDDIRTIRNLTHANDLPEAGS